MSISQLADEQKKLEALEEDARRMAVNLREQIALINALIQNQMKFETARAS